MIASSHTISTETEIFAETTDFSCFLDNFKLLLREEFQKQSNIDHLSKKRGFPVLMLENIMSYNPLSVGIPVKFGGRGVHLYENLAMLNAAAYESLALSLTLGINSALFLQPLANYGNESIKAQVFKQFIENRNMGGLMITEPNHGSDVLAMNTSYAERGGMYHVQGTKHWGGLTGMADFWLITARRRNPQGGLMHDIDFFVCDVSHPNQKIIVEEYYENLGLYPIPYGRNRIDVRIPAIQRLEPKSTGVQMMIDLLHRSRLHFPGMGLGFIKRILDESIEHTINRQVSNRSLIAYDQVQQRLARIQSAFTVCSALCARSSEIAAENKDLSAFGLEANIIKSVTADLMHEVSQSHLQLVGAKGYRLNELAGRAIVDSRPFQIFEGSNDILYTQISEALLKLMKLAKETNLFQFLKNHTLAGRSVNYLKQLLNFNISVQMPQRKFVELGNLISRVVSMDYVIRMGDKGFRTDLITATLTILQQDIAALTSSFSISNGAMAVVDYEENSSWLHQMKL